MYSKITDRVAMPFGSWLLLISAICFGLVTAVTDGGNSPNENVAAVASITASSTATSTLGIPTTPERFSILTSKGKAALTWSAATGTAEYKITRYEPKSGIEILIQVASTTLSVVDTGLHAKRTYAYSLYACNTFGCSYPTSLSATVK